MQLERTMTLLVPQGTQSPYRQLMTAPGFEQLDPVAIPWRELRRMPERFPDWHVAKVSSARTVVGRQVELELGSARLYFKRSLLRGFAARLLRHLRHPKEIREWQLAGQFAARGLNVPRPVFYGEAYDPSAGCQAIFLVTEALPDRWVEAKSYFRNASFVTGAWESLARFTRELHSMGIYHADYRADHLYVDPDQLSSGDVAAWAMIDLDGSSINRPVSGHRRRRALRQLTESLEGVGITEADLAKFISIYDPPGVWQLDARSIFRKSIWRRRG
jgi:hypothetical protein